MTPKTPGDSAGAFVVVVVPVTLMVFSQAHKSVWHGKSLLLFFFLSLFLPLFGDHSEKEKKRREKKKEANPFFLIPPLSNFNFSLKLVSQELTDSLA